MSKKSGVSVCALQNRCSKATQTVSPLFLFETKGTKMKIESQAILLQLVLTAKHRQLLRNHQLWFAKRKMPMCLRARRSLFCKKAPQKTFEEEFFRVGCLCRLLGAFTGWVLWVPQRDNSSRWTAGTTTLPSLTASYIMPNLRLDASIFLLGQGQSTTNGRE